MKLSTTRRILNVFLASPSDVAEERAIAEEVVSDLNKTIGRSLAWDVDLHKWEDTSPGFGRPQAKINDAVDGCQLFVGLLHERWGLPTGGFSSGFEEEFERAKTRRKEKGEPEIWIFFKAVHPERLKDPGPQLARVLEFRKIQTTLAEVLYKEVKDTATWRSELQTSLSSYLVNLALEGLKPSESEAPTATPTAQPSNVASGEGDSTEASSRTSSLLGSLQQLTDVCALLSEVVASGELEFSPKDVERLPDSDVARIYLLAWTWMSSRFTGDVIGTHEINLIYKHRDAILPTAREGFELTRAGLLDDADLKPSWFWNRKRPPEGAGNLLSYVAIFDRNSALRAKALKILAIGRIELPPESWPELPLYDNEPKVRFAAFEYLASIKNQRALEFLQEIAEKEEEPSFAKAAGNSVLKLRLRLDLDKSISELITLPETMSDNVLVEVKKVIPRTKTEILLKGITNSTDSFRLAVVEELARRKEISKPVAESLLNDSSLDVRALALSVLAELGERLDVAKIHETLSTMPGIATLSGIDEDSIVLKVFRSLTDEQLLEALDWYSLNGAVAYKLLATERFHLVSDHIRTDVAQEFRRLKEAAERDLRATMGPSADTIIRKWEEGDLNRFLTSRFLEAAAQGIVAHAIPTDITLARQWLLRKQTQIRGAALEIISRYGDASDVEAVLRLVKHSYDEIPAKAAIVALKLSPRPMDVVRELVNATSSDAVEVAFRWLLDQPLGQTKQFCIDLLGEPDDANRVRALFCLSKKLEYNELENLLKDYVQRDSYFYNVVCWLDRILYAPAPLREMFLREFEKVL